MSKLSKRLEMVASFIDENDKSVIDIGCDHGLLSIYLAEKFNNLKIIALKEGRRNEEFKNVILIRNKWIYVSWM